MVFAFLRNNSSRAISPASMVFAQPGIVGDEEIHARQPERLPQRLHLVGVDPDPGPERGLEEIRVGRGDRVPAQGVQEGRELARRIETAGGKVGPALLLQDAAVDLAVPEDLDRPPLRVVVGASQPHPSGVIRRRRRSHLFDQPMTRAHPDQFARLGETLRKIRRGGRCVHAGLATNAASECWERLIRVRRSQPTDP